jgi:hypothetical protein
MPNWFPVATKGEPRRWLWGCPRSPSHLGGIFVSASSTSTLPWGLNQRARRRTLPSMASSPGAQMLSWGLEGLCLFILG